MCFEWTADWGSLVGGEALWRAPLPVTHTAAHRIAVAALGGAAGRRSLLVTGLLKDRVFQIMGGNGTGGQ